MNIKINLPKIEFLNKLKSTQSITFLLFIAIIIWIAHFWHCGSLGLYEDDYNRVNRVVEISGWELANFILKSSAVQGRPLHDGLIYLFSFLGFSWAGLTGIYWLGYLIVTLNAFLYFFLLKRLYNQPVFFITGTLAFALYPADTTKAYITHSLGVQPSLTFLLIAFHCYLSRKTLLSYLIISCSIFCYETFFFVFIIAPFLRKNKVSFNLFKKLIKHTFILVIIFICVIIWRKLSGESRVADLSLITALFTPIYQTLVGPFVSISTFFYRPWQTLLRLNGELLIFTPLIFIVLFYILFKLKLNIYQQKIVSSKAFLFIKDVDLVSSIKKLTFIGLVTLFLSYPLTFTVAATEISGRNSRVHAAAIFGASILIACGCSILFYLANIYQKKNLATIILTSFFTLLIGFGLIVQHDNQRSWQYQQKFWTDVINLSPDLTDEVVILVDAPHLSWGQQLHPFDWTMPSILEHIYNFPKDWKYPPKLYLLNQDWKNKIIANTSQDQFDLNNDNGALFFYYPWEPKRLVDSSQIILLEEKNHKLTRRTTPLIIKNKKVILKQFSDSSNYSFEKGYLYNYLIKSTNKQTINYFNN